MKYVLYSGTRNASSWAMRAWLALREQDIEFDERIIDIRKPQRFEQLAAVGKFSPPAAVPVLVTETGVIFDSLAIMELASEQGAKALLPVDIYRRARARSFVAWQHSGLSNICPHLSFESAFYPNRRAMTVQETADCDRLFVTLENELKDQTGPYLFGDLSLADLAFVPTALRLSAHQPDYGQFPLTEKWIAALLERPSVREWTAEASELPAVWLEDYLADENNSPTRWLKPETS